jgi:8-oxo-dGTP pyrophosphatase MutT (NUDIX family)
MSESPDIGVKLILASGGLLWRKSDQERQILIIHRQRYDDWSLPKGKLEKGESWEEAALREVEEETGCPASIDSFAGILSYAPGGKPKVVLYFHMTPTGERKEIPMGSGMEVDAIQWVAVPEAARLLTYDAERDLLLSATKEATED